MPLSLERRRGHQARNGQGGPKVTGSHDQLATDQRRPGVRALDETDRTRLILPG
jgi:hypothetical protein